MKVQEKRRKLLAPVVTPAALHVLTRASLTPLRKLANATVPSQNSDVGTLLLLPFQNKTSQSSGWNLLIYSQCFFFSSSNEAFCELYFYSNSPP